jgi:nitrate/nitrite transporter NarK
LRTGEPPAAFIFGGPLSTLLLDMDGIAGLHGWQWLFVIKGAPVLLLAVAVLKLLHDGPNYAPFLTSHEKDFIAARLALEDGSKPAETGAAFRDARIFTLALVLFVILGAIYGLLLWLPQIVQAMGFANRVVGFIVAVPAVGAAAAMVWWGRSSDVSGERVWHLALAMLFSAAGFAIAAISPSNLTGLLALSAAFIGLFCCLPIVHNIPGTFLRGNAVAAGLGIFNTIGQFGGFVAPYIIGVTKQNSGSYASGMLIIAAGLEQMRGRSGAAAARDRRRAHRSPPEGFDHLDWRHTDAVGGDAFYQRLSERRATTIKWYLVDNLRLPAANLHAIGYGKQRPKNKADLFAPENRRVEIVNETARTQAQR